MIDKWRDERTRLGEIGETRGELDKREREREGGGGGEEAAARKLDLLMSVEIPRGSLGVPKHQRDCVPPAEVFHYGRAGTFIPGSTPSKRSVSCLAIPRYSGARSPVPRIDVQTDIADRSSGHRCKCAYSR